MSTYVKEIHIEGRKKNAAEKKKAEELLEKMREEDSKIVSGIFKNLEAPGCNAEFSYKYYKGEPIRTYNLEDGKKYDIPLGVAKHINKQCRYVKHKYLVDKEGNPLKTWDVPLQRYQFISTEYQQ